MAVNTLLHRLPVPVVNKIVDLRRGLNLSPMQKVLKQLRRRNVSLKRLHVLDVFGGDGKLQTRDYASQVGSLEVWEIEPECEASLRQNLPRAEIKITDSYQEIKNTTKKYDLIVIDNSPACANNAHYEHFDLFPDIFRLANDTSIIILNSIPQTDRLAKARYPDIFNPEHLASREGFYQTNRPENIPLTRMVERYTQLCRENGFAVEWYFPQRRGHTCVYYLVLKIVRLR
jgi:hypothetical protein